MKKLISLFCMIIIVMTFAYASIDFDVIHEDLQTIRRIANDMEILASQYMNSKISIPALGEEEMNPETKQAIKAKWILLRNELKILVANLP